MAACCSPQYRAKSDSQCEFKQKWTRLIQCEDMGTNMKPSPHSVKRWQLSGTDYEPQPVRSVRSEACFSSWTPLSNRTANLQVRTTLLITFSVKNIHQVAAETKLVSTPCTVIYRILSGDTQLS